VLRQALSPEFLKSHKMTYYLEKRDEQFEEKTAQVLFVYKELR
jgi:hypothetical protein